MDRALAKQVMWSRFIWFSCLIVLSLGWWRLMGRIHEERELEERAARIVNDECPIDAEPVDFELMPSEWREMTVGFCSDECSNAWDQLDDAARTSMSAEFAIESPADPANPTSPEAPDFPAREPVPDSSPRP